MSAHRVHPRPQADPSLDRRSYWNRLPVPRLHSPLCRSPPRSRAAGACDSADWPVSLHVLALQSGAFRALDTTSAWALPTAYHKREEVPSTTPLLSH
eukprot:scaffold9024_cov191-Isochrysis_galbana.AAC.1